MVNLLQTILRWRHYLIKAMINIMSWNVRGLNNANKQREVAHTLSIQNVGIFGLLETKIKKTRIGVSLSKTLLWMVRD